MMCPHCGGLLFQEHDGYEKYLECVMCNREYDLNCLPRRMLPEELESRVGIKLTESQKHGRVKI